MSGIDSLGEILYSISDVREGLGADEELLSEAKAKIEALLDDAKIEAYKRGYAAGAIDQINAKSKEIN